jgi:hypothetical protein
MQVRTEKTLLQEYKLNLKHYLLTTRFNNYTWHENQSFREAHQGIGCIYCSPEPIASHISSDKIIFMLEMNNDTNRIVGIGMVRNHPFCQKYHVYQHDNYNRYSYVGKHRIDRSEMTEEEERIMQIFDILCFKGNKHMKRGHGLKTFPIDILYRCSKKIDLVDSVCDMFKNHIKQATNK